MCVRRHDPASTTTSAPAWEVIRIRLLLFQFVSLLIFPTKYSAVPRHNLTRHAHAHEFERYPRPPGPSRVASRSPPARLARRPPAPLGSHWRPYDTAVVCTQYSYSIKSPRAQVCTDAGCGALLPTPYTSARSFVERARYCVVSLQSLTSCV